MTNTPKHFLAERDRGHGHIDYAVMCDYPGDGSKNVLIAENLSYKHAAFIVDACNNIEKERALNAELVQALIYAANGNDDLVADIARKVLSRAQKVDHV